MPIDVIATITAVSNLAGVMVKVWQAYADSREGRLNRQQQLLLQEAQHKHDRELARMRVQEAPISLISVPSENGVALDMTHPLLKRLQMEAEALNAYGFDVVYEQLSSGSYGLALPVGDDLMFCFLLSYAYPYQEPTVLIKAGDELQQVSFDSGAWNCNVTIANLVQNMTSAYFAEEDDTVNQSSTPAPPVSPANP